MNWSAGQYTKFESDRNRAIHDLLAQIPNRDVLAAADIGCGPGNSTELLRARFPNASIIGIDSSEEMIEAARKRLPDIHFEISDVSQWDSARGSHDVILANASLQWIPDHAALLPRLIASLSPMGSLAVQIPDNLEEPAHRLMREIAVSGPWAGKLAVAGREHSNRQTADWYYRALRNETKVNLWRTTYFHPLAGAAAIVEWFKGSGLRPFLEPLSETERETFLARYESAIAEAYPPMPDGTVLLPFPRLFFVATVPK